MLQLLFITSPVGWISSPGAAPGHESVLSGVGVWFSLFRHGAFQPQQAGDPEHPDGTPVVDWLMGLLLIALPSILGFARGVPESAVPVALGAAGLIVTFFTNHEYGVVWRIPMIAHLAVDGVAGAVLLVSPWVFGFADLVWVPHVILGLTELAAAFVTQTSPADQRRATAGRAV